SFRFRFPRRKKFFFSPAARLRGVGAPDFRGRLEACIHESRRVGGAPPVGGRRGRRGGLVRRPRRRRGGREKRRCGCAFAGQGGVKRARGGLAGERRACVAARGDERGEGA